MNGKTVCVGIQRLGAQEYGGGLVIAYVRHYHDQRVDSGVEADDLWEQVFDKLAVCGKHSHCYVEVTDVVIGIFTKHEHCEVLLFQTVLVQMLHGVVRHVRHLHLRDVNMLQVLLGDVVDQNTAASQASLAAATGENCLQHLAVFNMSVRLLTVVELLCKKASSAWQLCVSVHCVTTLPIMVCMFLATRQALLYLGRTRLRV